MHSSRRKKLANAAVKALNIRRDAEVKRRSHVQITIRNSTAPNAWSPQSTRVDEIDTAHIARDIVGRAT